MLPDGGIFGLSGLPGRRLDKRSAIGYLWSGEAVAKTPPDQLIIGMNMNNLLTLDPAAMTGNSVCLYCRVHVAGWRHFRLIRSTGPQAR
jgi:hypothetical protein